MFSSIANFFIKNSKLTLVLVLVSLVVWIWSYFSLPKQYNPTIVVPAFQIEIPAFGLDSLEVSRQIITPMENLIMELEWIDEVYWYAYDNYAWIMAKFNVWVNSEYAKIRLIQKINENLDLKPFEIWSPKITSIDPEELSQITYSINYIWNNLNQEETQIYLRQIANIIKDEVKTVKNLTTMEIVGWLKKDVVIELDLDKIKSTNTDILQVYESIKKYNINMPSWDIINSGEKIFLWIEAKSQNIEELKKLIISDNLWRIVYLDDVSNIWYWTTRISSYSTHYDREKTSYSVLIGFWKKKWTNAVFMTNDVIKKVDEIKETLPKDIELKIIQNEWETASKATNMLLSNMFVSIIIVFIILALYLWIKDAFNTAISIPLSLSLVFLIALIIWDNINKITLFALILVLWMIVDNSTVVVENISRHLNERINTWKTKLESVLLWVQEVWVWVIMSTVTRLLAFGAMFAVWGMMGEYMWPIPKYAIFALILSLIIALTINPWLSYLWAKDITESDRIKKETKENKYDPRKFYLSFMKKFINDDKKWQKNRKLFKTIFWITLFAVIIAPIYLWIFKARMLPKSDQNQIYVWIDAPRSTTASNMKEIEKDMTDYFLNSELDTNLDIVENITSTIGQAFMWDFANLFRWWLQRFWENQISARINLIDKKEYKKISGNSRITSEKYVIDIRDDFRNHMLSKHPDLTIMLHEDPPGPPVESTFMIKVKSNAQKEKIDEFTMRTYDLVNSISRKYSLEDLWTSYDTTYRKINIKIDNESLVRAWITSEQVASNLWIIYSDINVWLIKNNDSYESTSIILWVKDEQKNSISSLKEIYFTNNSWIKIPLESIASIEYDFVSPLLRTDKREEINVIYAEMWDNSLIYPVIKLFKLFLSDDFITDKYKVVSWNPYHITYLWLDDWKTYKIEWWWEWELTVDTFRDLWIAMMLSLLAIYFLLVWQFASFKIAWIIMITFLLSFFWVFPIFTFLYVFNNEYFSATSMIWIIALGWIVVWNAIILIEYLNVLKRNWLTIWDALLKAWYVRFAPIILTSLTTVFWAATIVWDPVWSWLAWAIIGWLFVSSILTLIVIPIFYFDSQKEEWEKCAWIEEKKCQ